MHRILKQKRLFYLLLLLLFSNKLVFAQKIGLVLSGGGASGLSHIGVLKALEEHNIPVDYISGTSIGALIGAYYSVGFTSEQIEQIVRDNFFLSVTKGDLPVKYSYMLNQREDFASWITFKFKPNDNYLKNLPTNVINSVPIDYYLMEVFSGVSNQVNHNFDSLMIPFRCVASDVSDKKSVVFRSGDLPLAIRASMSYPFYLRPIAVDHKLLFDGGLYNNFPIDVMKTEFAPDVIIGSNVAEENGNPDDDDLYMQLRNLMMKQSKIDSLGKNSYLIEPWSNVNTFNFNNAKRLIDSGYAATLRIIPKLKEQVKSELNKEKLKERRQAFASYRNPDKIVIDRIEIHGFTKSQERFIRKNLQFGDNSFNLKQLKKRYFRLMSDQKIKNIFPTIEKDSLGNSYSLVLNGKKEKPFYIDVGAVLSNRPISEAFLGLQYNHLGRIGFSMYANGYIGKLYSGSFSKMRFDFPGKVPFYIEPSFTYSRWDYYSSSSLFFIFEKPAYLVQEDKFAELKFGVPIGNISQFNISGGYTEWSNYYYQTDIFKQTDTTDRTYFDYGFAQANYKLNTQNRKMYATEGTLLNARARVLEGRESYVPGNTSTDTISYKNQLRPAWLQLKISVDSYVKTFKGFNIGFFGEAVYSTQSFFHNYESTILSAPAFNPIPESQTYFIDAFRAHNYFAGGMKLITTPVKGFDIRLEAYVFQPVQSILRDKNGKATYSTPFLYQPIIGMASLVYNTAVGPLSIGLNYYDKFENPVTFFFHFGYILFNRKSID
ncbi:MAG: patatin-like phospholipase family protein [Sphingobacteriaceae bacterium]|nr:patatin-like phospholipase family protein [Sphingobacteriaceae bacterium]